MSVLIKPLVTEKFSAMNEHGKYGFVVSRTANKVQIKQDRKSTRLTPVTRSSRMPSSA